MNINRVLDFMYQALGIRSGRMVPPLIESVQPVVPVLASIDLCAEVQNKGLFGLTGSEVSTGLTGQQMSGMAVNFLASAVPPYIGSLPNGLDCGTWMFQMTLWGTAGGAIVPCSLTIDHRSSALFPINRVNIGSNFEPGTSPPFVLNFSPGEQLRAFTSSAPFVPAGGTYIWGLIGRRITGFRQ